MSQDRLYREIDLLTRSHAETGINPLYAIIQLVRDSQRANGPEPAMPTRREFRWPTNGYAIPDGGRFKDTETSFTYAQ